MANFDRERYYTEYIAKVNAANQIRRRIDGLKAKLMCVDEEERHAVWAEIQAAEQELRAAEEEMHDAHVKAMTGKDASEFRNVNQVRLVNPFEFNSGRFHSHSGC